MIINIHYDPSADMLYCSFGPPQEAVGEEIDKGVVVRRDPKTNALVGITVVDFSQRFIAQAAVEWPVECLGLSCRPYNCLKNAGIDTISELLRWSERDLLRRKNFGRQSLNQVRAALADLGLTLRGAEQR